MQIAISNLPESKCYEYLQQAGYYRLTAGVGMEKIDSGTRLKIEQTVAEVAIFLELQIKCLLSLSEQLPKLEAKYSSSQERLS